ncbi:N-acetylglucosamine-6-phosphate deacetylase [Amaricoccus tamworthensis]|uniref:N-acetylglucosamine-6-phosphate deacetylase n=1 Tax=Amaricoccus tamworthensis TaxID=57002 RepID=UPI003C7CD2D5
MGVSRIWTGAGIFDGAGVHAGHALVVRDGRVAGIVPEGEIDPGAEVERLDGGLIAPGFVDLQVNGGDGVQLGAVRDVEGLRRIAQAHARLGATGVLPTLITSSREVTAEVIAAGVAAVEAGVPGVLGLHLEGPHLSVARKGAHDAALIRPMEAEDLEMLCQAARDLPVLMLTVAPESVTPEQIAALAEAGAVVSLGHSDAEYAEFEAAERAGARCVTHLFNAMSQIQGRKPGLVGAALSIGGLNAGLIADGVHVHPASMAAALAAKSGPGQIFLVSDAMAAAGTDLTEFELDGRRITRRDGVLRLADGTLAGADLDLATAVRVLVRDVGVDLERALAMATSVPGAVSGLEFAGRLVEGGPADFVWLGEGVSLKGVWRGGVAV